MAHTCLSGYTDWRITLYRDAGLPVSNSDQTRASKAPHVPVTAAFAASAWRQLISGPAGDFLPDFCNVNMVFLVVLATELMTMILALAQPVQSDVWSYLGLTSLFMQWITLVCTAVLCRLRKWLARQSLWLAALSSYAVILLVTQLFSWVTLNMGLVNLPLSVSDFHFYARNMAIAGIVGAVVLRYFYLQQQYRHRLRLESEARNMALQARIQPHFLFNSMNIIASLTRTNPRLAETVVENLSDLFRASLTNADRKVSLKEELDLCQRYLDIEQLRLGARLKVEMQLDEAIEHVQIPLLLIQPLVENAVYHGIQPRRDGGWVRVHAKASERYATIVITNPLPEQDSPPGHGLALNNIRERLHLLFGAQASLQTRAEQDQFVAELILPREMAL